MIPIPALLAGTMGKVLVAAAVAVSLAGWALLERNGKLSARIELEQQRSALAQCGLLLKQTQRAIQSLTEREARARAQAAQARRAAEAGREAIRAERSALAALMARPTPAGAGCEQAWGQIESGGGQ